VPPESKVSEPSAQSQVCEMREETAPGSPDVAIAKPVPAPTVQQQIGNQAMQRNRASVATANAKRPPDQQDSVALSPLDQALADAKAASDLLELVESTLFPAYRHAVDALDPIAALELGRNVVGSMKVAERGSRNVASTLSGNDYHHFLVSDPRYADESEPSIAAKFAALESYNLYLTSKISLLQLTLAGKIGPQMFRDKPVLGDFTVPQLGQDPDAYLADEAGTAVELIFFGERGSSGLERPIGDLPSAHDGAGRADHRTSGTMEVASGQLRLSRQRAHRGVYLAGHFERSRQNRENPQRNE
jgi:hypothetical protein